MPSIADVYVTILPETSRVADGIRRALRSVDDDMYRSGRRWGDEIKRGMGDVDVDVDADTSKARTKVKSLDRAIDKKRTVKVDTDKSSFAALATATRTIEQNFKAVAIAGLAIPNTVANVAQSVVQLSGVIGLLPATAGAAGLAIGTLKVATMGFGDAMKNVRDVDKFNESVAQLAPNMQQLAGSIRTALPEIDRLKFTVQDAFGAGLGEQFTKLSGVYLPMFQTVMSQMAASANTALTTVSQMLQQPAMVGDVSAMTGNMAQAFDQLSKALAPLVKTFVDVGVVGSGFLPQLAAAATDAANRFANFVEKARGTGDLAKWIQGGIDAMSQLGRITGDIFNIFMKFAGFQTRGGGLLDMIEGITSAVSDFVSSPAGQGALQTFITTLGDTVKTLLPIMGGLATQLAPVLGRLGTAFAELLQTIGPDLGPMIEDIGRLLLSMVETAVTAGATLTPVLQAILDLINAIPGGAATVVTAFLAWKSISGIASLSASLTGIANLLKLTLPAAAAQGAAGVSAAFASVAMPAWAVMLGVGAGTAIFNNMQAPVRAAQAQTAADTAALHAAHPGQPVNPLDIILGPGSIPGAPGGPFTGGSRPALENMLLGGGAPTTPQGPPSPTVFPGLPTPPVSAYTAPLPAVGGAGGSTPSQLVPTSPEAFWDAIAAKEAGGNWQNADTGGSGHYGGLQFSPETWAAFGGKEFAPMPHQASREQQMIVADRTAFSGYNGKPPQGLGAWEAVTKGMVPGVTTSTPSPGAPFAAGSAAAASSAGYPDTSGYTSDATPAIPQDPRSFAHDVMMPYWQQQGLTVGDHEADQYGEHQHGALDIMVPDIATGNQVLQQVLSDPNVYGAIFNKQSYGYGGGATGKPYTGANPHTDHVHAWYKPGNTGNIAPGGAAAAAYPNMGGYDISGYSPADYSGYKSIRDAGEKVSDTEARIGEEQAQLDALRVKSGVTPDQIAKQEREVAKAKREHRDALEDLTIAQNKYNDAASKSPDAKGGFGADFGKDFMGGILEFFGFDGSLFKNPADFGLMKLFGGLSKVKPRGEGGSGLAPGDTGGGGSGLESFLTSIIPQPFGPVQPGGSNSAPGQFLPNMPGSDSGGVVGRAFAPAGAPGPGNAIDNSITINNPVGQDHLRDTFDQAMGAEYPKMRQPMRSLPR